VDNFLKNSSFAKNFVKKNWAIGKEKSCMLKTLYIQKTTLSLKPFLLAGFEIH